MTVLKIKGNPVDVDIYGELLEYDFQNTRWMPDKLISSSPFRYDKAPSFFVNLDGELAGTWGDSGAMDYDYARGNFLKLIALLNDFTYGEAADYLIDKYGKLYEISPDEPIRIERPDIEKGKESSYMADNPITEAISPYLTYRGIDKETQEVIGSGYDESYPGFTAIPWRTSAGILANITYRSTKGKNFFYSSAGIRIRELVFGIDTAGNEAVITEGVIDAMSWMTAGYSAISVGGASISREQADIIKRGGIEKIYLGGDNDEQGHSLNRKAEYMLRGDLEISEIRYGNEKDANDVLLHHGAQGLTDIIRSEQPIRQFRISV